MIIIEPVYECLILFLIEDLFFKLKSENNPQIKSHVNR